MLPSSFQKVVGVLFANFGDMWLEVVAVWLTDWWIKGCGVLMGVGRFE